MPPLSGYPRLPRGNVISIVVVALLSRAWSVGILMMAWSDCGGHFGGYGAGANRNLDDECQRARSDGAAWPLFVVPTIVIIGLVSWRTLSDRSWACRSSHP